MAVAREQGVLEETDFASLMELREQTNTDRAEAVRRGEVVYGLTEFDDDEFYDHLLTAVRTEVGQRLSDEPGDPLHATEADVEAYFAAHSDRWRTNATRYDVVTLTVPAADGKAPGCRELLTGDIAAAALQDPNGCPTATTEQTALDGSDPTPQHSPQSRLLQTVSTLNVGAVAPATSTTEHVQRVGLLDAETDTAAALEQYRPRIRQALLDEQLTAYLEERRAGLDVDVDLDRLTALAQETLS
ncbi:hypothetical protein [Desertihabitans aurantiacus]|uniref:hypothetical protein n=1 Tax=Desertihabitans aurantiacus TaxID=2282477 RepID=UPI000DF805B7|nr:hypothetical protein [Desertihabitans aurantiacus]